MHTYICIYTHTNIYVCMYTHIRTRTRPHSCYHFDLSPHVQVLVVIVYSDTNKCSSIDTKRCQEQYLIYTCMSEMHL